MASRAQVSHTVEHADHGDVVCPLIAIENRSIKLPFPFRSARPSSPRVGVQCTRALFPRSPTCANLLPVVENLLAIHVAARAWRVVRVVRVKEGRKEGSAKRGRGGEASRARRCFSASGKLEIRKSRRERSLLWRRMVSRGENGAASRGQPDR